MAFFPGTKTRFFLNTFKKELTASSKFHYITQRLQPLSLLGIKELMATAVRDLKAIASTAERKANGNFQHFLAQCGKRKCKPLPEF